MVKEKWTIYGNKADYNAIGQKYNMNPLIAKIMWNRQVNEEDFHKYLNGSIDDMYSPWLFKDMEKAVDIIMEKINENKKIRIVGDYDIDGICASYILKEGLRIAGGNVSYDIPDRVKDGYGINESIIKKAYDDGIDTIITCDNGIAAIDAVKLAKDLGMTIIVTDHHEVPFEEEDGEKIYIRVNADATINPKQPDCNYPFKLLCGGAIAFKFIIALFEKKNIEKSKAMDYLEFAAIATVGDIVDLQDENRIIAKWGIQKLRETRNTGLNALINKCGVNKGILSSYHIGFVIGPCLNASGRLETAKLALELLDSKEKNEAEIIAERLVELNDLRKAITEKGVKDATDIAEKYENQKILVIYLDNIHESVAGIVAGRIKEAYNKPVIVLTKSDEDGVIKGSGRSIECYDMFENLSKVKELFLKFGGHKMAAGLSLEEKNLEILRERLNSICNLNDEDMVRKIAIDVHLKFDNLNFALCDQLKVLEPFGKGNEKPVFGLSKVSVRKINIIGKNKNVIKMRLSDDTGITVEAVMFNRTEEFSEFIQNKFGREEWDNAMFGKDNNIKISCTCYPDINEYNGMKNIQIIVNNYC